MADTDSASSAGPQVWEMLRAARVAKRHTLISLGQAIGLSFSYISQIENCRKDVRRPTLVALATELGVDVDLLAASKPPVVPYESALRREAA